LAARGIGITSAYSATKQRWVTHLDVDSSAVENALAAVQAFFSER
jgi:threonine aldolase